MIFILAMTACRTNKYKINYSEADISNVEFEKGYGDYWMINGTQTAIIIDNEVSYEGEKHENWITRKV